MKIDNHKIFYLIDEFFNQKSESHVSLNLLRRTSFETDLLLSFESTLQTRNHTVEPLLSGHPLSGHPLLSGQLLKSRNYCQYNTVNKTPFKRPPLLSDRGYFSAVPMSVLLLFYPNLAASKNVICDVSIYFQQHRTVMAD